MAGGILIGNSKDKMRLFISIDMDGALDLDRVTRSIEDIRGNIRTVDRDKVHITLKFLGDTPTWKLDDIKRVMREAVEGEEPFDMRCRGIGAFPKREYVKVLWLGVEGEEAREAMSRMAGKLEDGLSKLDVKRDRKGFHPHITIARVRSVRDKKKLYSLFDQYEDHDFGELEVRAIRLKKSVLGPGGPSYTTLEEVILGEGEDRGDEN